MSFIQDSTADMVREFDDLAMLRAAQGWDAYWRDCMTYALPQDVSFDTLLSSGGIGAVTNQFHSATVSAKSKNLYDQTSLWAIERLTSGLITLKTPEGQKWHGLGVDDPYGYEATLKEEEWFDGLNRYLFNTRSNPRTGFWPSHKAAVRSTCAMGDGFMFLEELFGNDRAPFRYSFVPLGECFVSVDASGQLLRFYRLRRMTAEQIVGKWGDKASGKIRAAAGNPSRRQETFDIIHAVVPRPALDRHGKMGVMGATWGGAYLERESKALLGESGYWEMPYIQHSWNNVAGRPYSEGPLALALAEIKSLNEMAKNELISAQQAVRPPLATIGENFGRINLNAGKVNAGLVSGEGNLLVKPIMTHTRPDFAQAVLEQRRNSVREMLYLNLWQILIDRPDMTATEAMLRSQEKGELLGPVGISFNQSLSYMVQREVAILARKGAFEEGSPLAAPPELLEREVAPKFTAPLDRMRNMDEVLGAQRTVQGMMEVAAFDPTVMDRLDVDKYAELLRKGNGAPANLFRNDEDVKQGRDEKAQIEQLSQTLAAAQQGGDAAAAMGSGVQAIQGAAAPSAGPAPDVAQAVAA